MWRPTAFFSASGRSPRLRLGLVLALTWVTEWVCAPVWEGESLSLFLLAGALLGVALSKAAAEMIRRLHDMGSGAAVGGLILLVLSLASAAAHIAAMAYDGPWVMLTKGLALSALAVLMVWPGEKGTNRFGEPARAPWRTSIPLADGPDRTRWLVPLLGVGGLEAVLLCLALVSYGLARSNERTMQFVRRSEAEHQRARVRRSEAEHQRALAGGAGRPTSDRRP